MSDKPSLPTQVDLVFGKLEDRQYELVAVYLSTLNERLVGAERAAVRGITAFLLLWLVAYLVSEGFVRETEISGLKVERLQALLVIVPAILGFISYAAQSALATIIAFEEIIRLVYDKLFPGLEKTDLDTVFMGHTFIGAEHVTIATKQSWVDALLKGLVGLGIVTIAWVAPPLAIGHTTYLVVQSAEWPMALASVSAVAGVIFWLRGVTMISHRI